MTSGTGRAEGVRLLPALEYDKPVGYRPLELDLYLPELPAAGRRAPIVVFLHGGGWRVGSRRVFGPAFAEWDPSPFRLIAGAGFAVASVDYRLSGEAHFPAQLDDVRAAARWLTSVADQHGLDPDRVVLWGESAGGHLAALLGLTSSAAEAAEPFRVRGVVDWYGPADLRTLQAQSRPDAVARSDDPDSRESSLLGAPLADSPELAAAASPISYVHPAAPEFLLVHGDVDRFVPTAQSEQLAAALGAAGVPVELRLVAGADHMFLGTPEVADIFAASLAFARRVADLEA